VKWIVNKDKSTEIRKSLLNENTLFEVKSFHESFQEYQPTPLVRLERMAEYLGVSEIFLKDESFRFGLNAFKVLGASFAIGKYLSRKFGKDISRMPMSEFKSRKVAGELKSMTLVATTDGNHGRGVAWMAKQLGCDCIIYMPKGSTQNRVDNIKQFGASVIVTEWNYDDTVRFTAEQAQKNGWEVIQDTAWEGYVDVPTWIMQGYSTMAQEVMAQLKEVKPTHIFLQAGVGAFASIMADIFVSVFKEDPPKIIIVEPDKADCFYKSAQAGKISPVTGDLNTIMAGLSCGEPNPIAWDILRCCTDLFISASDWMAARGMRILGNPLEDDARVISGESGAITAGVLSVITTVDKYKDIKELLKIDGKSKVLLFSTEGDTDSEIYRRIVWDGDYKSLL
jgi:diaminopropionate ammonia-lyase